MVPSSGHPHMMGICPVSATCKLQPMYGTNDSMHLVLRQCLLHLSLTTANFYCGARPGARPVYPPSLVHGCRQSVYVCELHVIRCMLISRFASRLAGVSLFFLGFLWAGFAGLGQAPLGLILHPAPPVGPGCPRFPPGMTSSLFMGGFGFSSPSLLAVWVGTSN